MGDNGVTIIANQRRQRKGMKKCLPRQPGTSMPEQKVRKDCCEPPWRIHMPDRAMHSAAMRVLQRIVPLMNGKKECRRPADVGRLR